jgi:hypothetical protein
MSRAFPGGECEFHEFGSTESAISREAKKQQSNLQVPDFSGVFRKIQ